MSNLHDYNVSLTMHILYRLMKDIQNVVHMHRFECIDMRTKISDFGIITAQCPLGPQKNSLIHHRLVIYMSTVLQKPQHQPPTYQHSTWEMFHQAEEERREVDVDEAEKGK